jgi:hypothetical protein
MPKSTLDSMSWMTTWKITQKMNTIPMMNIRMTMLMKIVMGVE